MYFNFMMHYLILCELNTNDSQTIETTSCRNLTPFHRSIGGSFERMHGVCERQALVR